MMVDNLAKQIADYYGLDSQSRQCSEECAELIVALSKLRRDDVGPHCAIYNVAEEIADVTIMIMQMMYLLDIPDQQIEDVIDEKLERTINEINRKEMGCKA